MNWRNLTDTIRFFFKSRSEAAKLLREAMTQVQQAEDLRQQVRTLQEDLRGYEALKIKVKDLQSRLAYRVDLKGDVKKLKIKPGDILFFRHNRKEAAELYDFNSFGVGLSALKNLQEAISDMVGGRVFIVASKDNIDIQNCRDEAINAVVQDRNKAVADLQEKVDRALQVAVQREHEARHLAKEIKSLRAKNRGRK